MGARAGEAMGIPARKLNNSGYTARDRWGIHTGLRPEPRGAPGARKGRGTSRRGGVACTAAASGHSCGVGAERRAQLRQAMAKTPPTRWGGSLGGGSVRAVCARITRRGVGGRGSRSCGGCGQGGAGGRSRGAPQVQHRGIPSHSCDGIASVLCDCGDCCIRK